jgi:hypothetical protein
VITRRKKPIVKKRRVIKIPKVYGTITLDEAMKLVKEVQIRSPND